MYACNTRRTSTRILNKSAGAPSQSLPLRLVVLARESGRTTLGNVLQLDLSCMSLAGTCVRLKQAYLYRLFASFEATSIVALRPP
jgi:hypothetical protein